MCYDRSDYNKVTFGYIFQLFEPELCVINKIKHESICYSATSFVGTAVVQELLGAGYQVLGLARLQESVKKLIEAGAEAHRGDLADFESLKSGARLSDAVIHLGFVHDFGRFQEIEQKQSKSFGTNW